MKHCSQTQSMSFMVLISVFTGVNGYTEGNYWAKGEPLPDGKPWPLKYTVTVKANVKETGGGYIYNYALGNPARNMWPISSLEIDLRKTPGTHPFPMNDLTLNHTYDQHVKILREAEVVKASNIASPVGWDIDRDLLKNKAIWGTRGGMEGLIVPGSFLSGFGLRAEESPGVRDFAVSAEINAFELDYSWPMKKIIFYEGSAEYIAEVSMAYESFGKTIAPVAPPEPFSVSSWTVRMTEDVVEARKQTWIKTDKNLTEIKKLIANLGTKDTTKLSAAVQQIEIYISAEKKKGNLTNEADVLVRLNAQYLLRRLGNPSEKADENAKKQP